MRELQKSYEEVPVTLIQGLDRFESSKPPSLPPSFHFGLRPTKSASSGKVGGQRKLRRVKGSKVCRFDGLKVRSFDCSSSWEFDQLRVREFDRVRV